MEWLKYQKLVPHEESVPSRLETSLKILLMLVIRKKLDAFIPFKRRKQSEGLALWDKLCVRPYTLTLFSLCPAARTLGEPFWQMVLMSLQGKKIKDLRIFWQCYLSHGGGHWRLFPSKTVFSAWQWRLSDSVSETVSFTLGTNRWRYLVKSQISLRSDLVQHERYGEDEAHSLDSSSVSRSPWL